MGRYTPADYEAARAAYARQLEGVNSAAVSATHQSATGIVQDNLKYPFLDPGVVTLMNQAGMSDTARETVAYANAHTKMRDYTTEPPIGVLNPSYDPNAPAAPAKDKRSNWDKAFHPFAWAASQTLGRIPGLQTVAKGATRAVTTALAAPYQVMQNTIGKNILDPVAEGISDVAHGRFSELPGDLGRHAIGVAKTLGSPITPQFGDRSVLNATDAAQSVANIDKMGSGWFAGKGIQDLTAIKAREARGVDPGGSAWTIGRFVTAPLPQKSWLHDKISGTVDVASAIALDPMNILGGAIAPAEHAGGLGAKLLGPIGSRIAKARYADYSARIGEAGVALKDAAQAASHANEFRQVAEETAQAGAHAHAAESLTHAQAWDQISNQLVGTAEHLSGVEDVLNKAKAANPEWVKTVQSQAGLLADTGKGRDAMTAAHFKWLLSENGQDTINALTDIKSPSKIMAMYGNKLSVADAAALAQATSPEETIRALGQALDVSGAAKLRAPGYVASARGIDFKASVADRFPTLGRAMGTVPNSGWMDFSKPEEAFRNLYDTLGNVKIVGTQRTELADRWLTALAAGDRGTMFQLGEETSGLIGQQLKDAGMHSEDADGLVRSFAAGKDEMRAYMSDIPNMVPASFMDGEHAPLRVSQILDSGWALPDAKEASKLRIATGRVKYLLGEEGSARRLPVVATKWLQDRVFKPLVVNRPALAARLLPDEAIRMAMGGHVTDAGGIFTAWMNAPKSSAMGASFDAPGKILEADRTIAKLTKGRPHDLEAAVKALVDGDTGSLVAKYPHATDEIARIGGEHQAAAGLLEKVINHDNLTRAETARLNDLTLAHGGDDAADALANHLVDLRAQLTHAALPESPELTAAYADRLRYEKELDGPGRNIIEAMSGKRGNGSIGRRLDGQINDTVLYKSGSRIIVQRNDPRYAEFYRQGLGDELISQHADPVYRRIANGGLLVGDHVPEDQMAVGRAVDEFTSRRQQMHASFAELDQRRQAAEDALDAHHAGIDQALAPHYDRIDTLTEAADAAKQRIAEREQAVARLERKLVTGARPGELVDRAAGAKLARNLDEATQRAAAAKSNLENELEALKARRTAALDGLGQDLKYPGGDLEAHQQLVAEWDDRVARAERSAANRIARQDVTVKRLQSEYKATGHARIVDLEQRIADARKDLVGTRAIEGAEDYRGQIAESRRTIREARTAAKPDQANLEAEVARIEKQRGAIERQGAKIDVAFKKGLLDAPGRTHLGVEPSTLDDVKEWLYRGTGREYAEQYFKGIKVNDVTRDNVSEWVDMMAKDVDFHWGSNAEARQAIVSGQIRGDSIRATGQWGPKTPHPDGLSAWANEYAASADAPSNVRYEPTLQEARKKGLTFAQKASEQRDKLANNTFAAFYGNKSDKFLRIPEYAGSYWSNMEEMIPRLHPDEAAALLDNLEHASLPASQEARVRNLARGANGNASLEDADRLAHGYALDDVNKLMFDMGRKNQFQDMANVVAPFGRAWWEVISTWSKIGLGAEGPLLSDAKGLAGAVETAGNAVKRGANAATMAHSADRDLRALHNSGWFYKDENNQDVFNIPLSGELAKIAAAFGAPTAPGQVQQFMRGKVSGLSLGTSILPGMSPVLALPAWELTKHMPLPDSAVHALFPMGKPKSIAGSLSPGWFDKMNSAWNGDTGDAMYGNTLMEVTRSLANSGKYGYDADSLDKLMGDARKQASAMMMLRGVVQAFSPAAPIPTYVADTKVGDVTVAKLAQEYQKIIADPAGMKAAGYASASEAFMARFGPQAVYYLFGKTKTTSGGETPSEQFGRWQESHQDLAGKYPNVFGYFGPQTEGYSQTVQQRQIDMGTRVRRTPNDILALANAKIGDMQYYGLKDQINAANAKVGVKTMTVEQRAWLAAKRSDIEQQFPGWDVIAKSAESRAMQEKRMAQLAIAVVDPKVRDTPTGQSLASYMRDRARVQDEAVKRGITGWGQANDTADLRAWLTGRGADLGAHDPGFAALFDDVLTREMKD